MQTTIVESHRSSDEGTSSDCLSQLCRLCAKKNSCMIPIFRGQGLMDDLPLKIKAYVPFEVSEDDTLPLQVCSSCVQCLTMWHEFITGCLKADGDLRATYQEMLKAKADRESSKIIAEERHNQQITEGRSSVQQEDEMGLDRVRLTNENDVDGTSDTRSNERCSATVGEMDTTSSHLHCQMEVYSGQIDKTENNTSVTPIDHKLKNTFKCDQCGKALASNENLKVHLRIHSGEKPYTCQICGVQFTCRSGIKRHLKEVHEGVKDHVCQICGRAFANKQTLQDHIRIHTGERPYTCDNCKKTFKTKASLYVHKKCHTAVYTHTCPVCGKQFYSKTLLTRHKLNHTGERPHCCDVCGKSFSVKYDLKKHKLTHTTEKPFVCSHCFCSFKQIKYLRQHTKSQSCKLEHIRDSLDPGQYGRNENSQDPDAS